MKLLSHKHTGFRGLADNQYTLSDLNLVVGDNGIGKTSLLEAVYVSLLGTPLNSFNKAGKELSRDARGDFAVESTLVNGSGRELKLAFLSKKNIKKLTANGEKITTREAFLGTPVCLIDSNVEKISSESPDYRRRLVDRSVFHVEQKHAESYKRLQKAIKQRNRSIKNGESEKTITSWDGIISEEGERVTKHRNTFTAELQEELKALNKQISTKIIKIEFKNGWGGERLFDYLEKNIRRDMAAKRTMGGPHRGDLLVTLDGKLAKEYSSKGEEKQMSLAVSFAISRLIEKKCGARPILLIDELESGLDETALYRIADHIKNLKNQSLITTLKHHKIKDVLRGKTIHPNQHNC